MAEKILIVDDDLETLRLIGIMLEQDGYQITAASNGKQALTLAKSSQPDLVLLDLMMPDMDGFDIARELRTDPQTERLPIIMLTAKSQLKDKLDGFDAGADDYLTKPIQHPELVAHVKAVLKRTGRKAVPPLEILDKPGTIVGVIAAKGGVGVSTVALNLGVAIFDLYNETVIISDQRPGCGTLGLALGYFNFQNSNEILTGDVARINVSMVADALLQHQSGIRLLLSSPHPHDAKYSDRVDHFDAMINKMMLLAHHTVLDLGTSLTLTNERALSLCDHIVVVLEPVPQTIFQTKSLLDHILSLGIEQDRISIVLSNRVNTGMGLSLGQVQDQLGAEVHIILAADPELAYQSLVNNSPLVFQQPDGVIAGQFIKLADRIVFQLREKSKQIK